MSNPQTAITEIIGSVLKIDRATPAGRKAAQKAVSLICEQIGATTVQRTAAVDALFSDYARPRISLANARKLMGGVSRITFWRWRKDNRYGLGTIDVIQVTARSCDTYLDQILGAMKQRAEQTEIGK